MLQAMKRKICFGLVVSLATVMGAFGCNNGDTDGGPANDDLGPQGQYVSDGGAGSTLRISVKDSLTVGGQVAFSVVATDPNGLPLSFIRIFCESERGIAIIEPSSNGFAFESTGSNGSMSGVLGGVLPGSFLLECRAPEGFNLVARESIHITGEVPDGFEGFPGAAGGNLGGGVIIDQTDDEVSVSGFSVVTVTDGTIIDISQDTDCDNDGTNDDVEPFGFDDWTISVDNDLNTSITVTRVQVTVLDGGPGSTSNQTVNVPINGNTSAQIQGPLTEFTVSPKSFAGGSDALTTGTFNVRITVEYETSNGDTSEVTGRGVVTIGNVDNCGS